MTTYLEVVARAIACLLCLWDRAETAMRENAPATQHTARILAPEIARQRTAAHRWARECGGSPAQMDHYAWAHLGDDERPGPYGWDLVDTTPDDAARPLFPGCDGHADHHGGGM